MRGHRFLHKRNMSPERFGMAAMRWVSSAEGKELRLRGLNARVIQAGEVRVGDAVRVLTRR